MSRHSGALSGRDGLEYGGPLSRIPKGVLADKMTVAPDIWEGMLLIAQEAA
ncbi:hypothetical protein [Bradyrhizobium sp. GM2.2]|uniref:hypothetical protein n=1 Tax=Bradyrhizobium sp. GM2.2 TaxID=3156358 RepID=UPI00339760DA